MMVMTPTQDSLQARLKVSCTWTIRERKNGLVLAEKQVKNVWTEYGLTALASAILGKGYTAPVYLVIEDNATTLAADAVAGAMQVQLTSRVDQQNDTQLVLNPGQTNQEVVTFASVSGSGPFVYALVAPVQQSHSQGSPVVRQITANDTMASITNEQQYDSVNFPNQRMLSPSGYSGGPGNAVVQFYFPGPSALLNFVTCGLADSPVIGQGNLHNHFILAYNHTDPTTDLEIDGSLTLTNP
jgi:hypothetical protein